jgi:hypothetical protein
VTYVTYVTVTLSFYSSLISLDIMQPYPLPNRVGLGLRPPMQSFGQGPTIAALAQQQMGFNPPQAKQTTLFVGSISGGITDDFMNDLLKVCNFFVAEITSYWLFRLVVHSGRSSV